MKLLNKLFLSMALMLVLVDASQTLNYLKAINPVLMTDHTIAKIL